MTGTVIRIFPTKGFGFIRGEDGNEHFFHRSAFHGHFDDLCDDFDNQVKVKVNFTMASSPKGPRAEEVTRLDDGNPLASTANY